jgi:hypothetical protein
MKKKVLAITLVIVILVAFTTWLIINQLESQAQREVIAVKIADFKWTSYWFPGPSSLTYNRGFNITLNNTGNQDLDGVKVEVKCLVNGTERYSETWLGDYPNMSLSFRAGQAGELPGAVILGLSDFVDPGGELNFIVDVSVNGTVLDELQVPNEVLSITGFWVDDSWENPGGLLLDCRFNFTVHNIGTEDLDGLELEVRMFINDSEVEVGNYFEGVGEYGLVSLSVGEVREFTGTVLYTWKEDGVIYGAGYQPDGASYIVRVKWGDVILGESETSILH